MVRLRFLKKIFKVKSFSRRDELLWATPSAHVTLHRDLNGNGLAFPTLH